MRTRILNLDGGIVRQTLLTRRTRAAVLPLREWGPRLRLACRHGSFARFQKRLARYLGSQYDTEPFLSFIGSGDFHHISLALLRRLRGPFNLLVLDNHPDWMRGVPLLHCGTWLWHAAHLPGVQRIFHLGGAVDFDNAYRWLAPWPLLRSGKIVVAPARQRFHGRWWDKMAHRPLRPSPECPAAREDIESWLAPYRDDLAAWPLYVSLDKDVLPATEAVVNWDSGHLSVAEVLAVLEAFGNAASENWAGMDLVGDWSPVRTSGLLRRFLDWSEHPTLTLDADEATRCNEALNLRLLACLPGTPLPLSQVRCDWSS